MAIEQWWSKLDASTRQWLIDHNGEPIPAEVVDQIHRVGDTTNADGDLVRDEDGPGVALSDEAVDWVEAVANDESPEQS